MKKPTGAGDGGDPWQPRIQFAGVHGSSLVGGLNRGFRLRIDKLIRPGGTARLVICTCKPSVSIVVTAPSLRQLPRRSGLGGIRLERWCQARRPPARRWPLD